MRTSVWPWTLSAGLRVAIDEVVGDQLAAVGLDADRVAGDAVELDRPGEVDADGVGFDDVGVVEVGAEKLPEPVTPVVLP